MSNPDRPGRSGRFFAACFLLVCAAPAWALTPAAPGGDRPVPDATPRPELLARPVLAPTPVRATPLPLPVWEPPAGAPWTEGLGAPLARVAGDPRSVERLDPSAAGVPAAAAEVLRGSLAADLQARGPLGAQRDIALRGATFSQTLVLVDNRPQTDPQIAHHNLDLPVTSDDLERVEVAPGPSAARFGADAIGGAVNFRTRPAGSGRAALSGWGGSYASAGGRLRWPVAGRGWGQTFTLERAVTAGDRPDTQAETATAGYAAERREGGRIWTARLGYLDKRFGAADFYGPYLSWEYTRSLLASIALTAPAGAEAEWSPVLGYRRHEDDFLLDVRRPGQAENLHTAWSGDAALPLTLRLSDGGRLRLALEAHPEHLESSAIGRHDRWRTALTIGFESPERGRWQYALGLRADRAGAEGQGSPSLGLAFRPDPDWNLRLTAARAFRPPSFTELYYAGATNLGDPDLKSEHAWAVEAGADWRPAAAFSAAATAFRRELSDGIDWVRASAAEPWRAVNLRTVSAAGAELRIASDSAFGEFSAGYLWQSVSADAPPVQSKYQLNTPAQRFLAAARWQAGAWEPAAQAAYVRRPAADWAWLVDAELSWRAQADLSLFARVTNACDASAQEIPGVPPPGRWTWAGATLSFF